MDQLRQRLLAAYPDGLSFAPMALRLLRNNFPELDDATVASLKEEMVEDDQCWFFPEQIADAETLKEISQQAEAWLDAYSFFASGALYSRFKTRLRHCGRDGQFEKFFDMIREESMDFSKLGSCLFYRRLSTPSEQIETFAVSLVERVEAEGGEIAEDQLLAENPHLDAPSLAVLCGTTNALVRTDVSGFSVWRSVEVASEHLPADFDEVVTLFVDRLVELDYSATFKRLEMLLSVHYGSQFNREYNLTEDLFCTMVSRHYRGGQQIKWINSRVYFVASRMVESECSGMQKGDVDQGNGSDIARKPNGDPLVGLRGYPLPHRTWANYIRWWKDPNSAMMATLKRQGVSEKEIARQFNLSEVTVRSNRLWAYENVPRILAHNGLTSEDVADV